jgi:predicted transcriptional regulator
MLVLKRGRFEVAYEILKKAAASPKWAPTRVLAVVGVGYVFLSFMVNAGLVEAVKIGRRRRRLMVTPKGREFMLHFKVCQKLFPEQAQKKGAVEP